MTCARKTAASTTSNRPASLKKQLATFKDKDRDTYEVSEEELSVPVTVLEKLVVPPMTQVICSANLRWLAKVSTPFVQNRKKYPVRIDKRDIE